jgi:hypothetical protein
MNFHILGKGSSVGIATGYRLDGRGVRVRVRVGARFVSSPRCPDRFWGPTQPPIQWVPWVKRPGREAVHSPPTSAEVKNKWIYTSTPPDGVRSHLWVANTNEIALN